MEDLRCNDNIKVLGKVKDECNSLLLTEFLALNPKVYSFKYQAVNKEYKDEHKKDLFEISHKEILENCNIDNKRTCKGVDKISVKKDITHQEYIDVIDTNKPIKKDVFSIRSFNHQLFTYYQSKVALTSYYDKMYMKDKNNNIPYGFID